MTKNKQWNPIITVYTKNGEQVKPESLTVPIEIIGFYKALRECEV